MFVEFRSIDLRFCQTWAKDCCTLNLFTTTILLENLKLKAIAKRILYTVILFSAKMAEIHLKVVEYVQLRFDHHFWSKLR
jgi:hypothetical protein